ncbi:MAG: SDR family oxidoreductase [Phycisphaerales bacterium]
MSGRPSCVLVAGAGGVLGRLVVDELIKRGHRVRAIVRRPAGAAALRHDERVEVRIADTSRPGAWTGVCNGVDRVFSSIGASVNPSPLVGWKTYTRVDAPVNIALIEEARRAGVKRFVYVSLIHGDTSRRLDYSEGHERVVDALRKAAPAATVLRPTGFFAAMGEIQDLAKRWRVVPVFGDGNARTNPIHEADLAAAAADALADDAAGLREVPLGGPDVFTRRQVVELAFQAIGRPPRIIHSPAWMARAGALPMGLLNPRAAHFLRFAAHVMTHECVAPAIGTRRLEEYFRQRAARRAIGELVMGSVKSPLESSDSPEHRTLPENRP